MEFTPRRLQMGASGAGSANYIEEVFSTYLYTGNGSTQTITNNIDLSTKGGLTWIKGRSGATGHRLTDTARGVTKSLASNSTAAEATESTGLTAFSTTGFTIGADADYNTSAATYVSWTFREQPKFFDVVTYTGNDTTSGRAIPHNLGSTPGFVIIKNLTTSSDWTVWHRSLTSGNFIVLNTTAAQTSAGAATRFGNGSTTVDPTSTDVTVGGSYYVNADGYNYVMYVFAHNAGGFGLTGTDNVISCGSFSGSVEVNLGYEAQWILIKDPAVGDWYILDIMRGMSNSQGAYLRPNANNAEASSEPAFIVPTATGFKNVGGGNYIYIAIRRGPMKVPTSGTSVFAPAYGLNAGANGQAWNAGFPVDMYIRDNPAASDFYTSDRLRGSVNYLLTNSTAAESNVAYSDKLDNNIGVFSTNAYDYTTWIGWQFRRAPSFFDEVCYTGTEVSGQTFNHNLGAVPEMMIVKSRSGTTDWTAYHSALGASARIYPNATNAAGTGTAAPWNSTAPTSSVFSLGNAGATNLSGATFVNYLFATCPGVSKVGSYTGTGTTLQVNCGFTGGARFVLIKRTDSTGAWYVWDSARGIIAGNDPYLLLNTTDAEVTNTDYIDTYSAGFEISSTAPAAINANGGTYIFLAIA